MHARGRAGGDPGGQAALRTHLPRVLAPETPRVSHGLLLPGHRCPPRSAELPSGVDITRRQPAGPGGGDEGPAGVLPRAWPASLAHLVLAGRAGACPPEQQR